MKSSQRCSQADALPRRRRKSRKYSKPRTLETATSKHPKQSQWSHQRSIIDPNSSTARMADELRRKMPNLEARLSLLQLFRMMKGSRNQALLGLISTRRRARGQIHSQRSCLQRSQTFELRLLKKLRRCRVKSFTKALGLKTKWLDCTTLI